MSEQTERGTTQSVLSVPLIGATGAIAPACTMRWTSWALKVLPGVRKPPARH